MSLFAIADTHLSLGTNKPMDSFPGWNDYVQRLEKNWNNILTDSDTVVFAADFDFLNKLNGRKIIVKGNHDYWWNTATKMNKFIESNKFDSIKILHNNSYTVNNISVCASRGWMFESDEEHDEKILNREVNRLKMSLDSAECEQKLVFLHYPPVTVNSECREILNLLNEYGIKKCYYGHLHGMAVKYAVEGEIDGIDFNLISCDRLKFTPKLISSDKEL